MIRVLIAFLILGLGAIAWIMLLPDAGKPKGQLATTPPAATRAAVAAPAAQPAAAEAPAEGGRDIRVVYPGPDGTATVRKLADKVAAEVSPVPAAQAAVPPVQPASAAPTTDAVPATPAPVETAAVTPSPAVDTPPGPGAALNINTASVEALNQLPGAGHIGRTIASHRPYGSIDELVSKRVLRKSVYDRIKDQIATN